MIEKMEKIIEIKIIKTHNCLICRNFSVQNFFEKKTPCEHLNEGWLFLDLIKGFECVNFEPITIKIYNKEKVDG